MHPTSSNRSFHQPRLEALIEETSRAEQNIQILDPEISRRLQALIDKVERQAQECIKILSELTPEANLSEFIHTELNQQFRALAREISCIERLEPPYDDQVIAEHALQIIRPVYLKCKPEREEFKNRNWAEYALEVEQEVLHSNNEEANTFQEHLAAVSECIKNDKAFFANPIVYVLFAHPTNIHELWTIPFIETLKSDLESLGVIIQNQKAVDSKSKEKWFRDQICDASHVLVIGAPSLVQKKLKQDKDIAAQLSLTEEKPSESLIPLLLNGTYRTAFPAGFADSYIHANSTSYQRMSYLKLLKQVSEKLFHVPLSPTSGARQKWDQMWSAFTGEYPLADQGLSQDLIENDLIENKKSWQIKQEIYAQAAKEMLSEHSKRTKTKAAIPLPTGISPKPFENIQDAINQKEYSKAIRSLFFKMRTLANNEEVRGFFYYLTHLIPKFSEDEIVFLENSLFLLLNKSASFVQEQQELATTLAEWHMKHHEPYADRLATAMAYWAKAVQLAEFRQEKKEAKMLHEKASQLLISLVKIDRFKTRLMSALRGGIDEIPNLQSELNTIEKLHGLHTSREAQKETVQPLYDAAEEVLAKTPPQLQEKYQPCFDKLESIRTTQPLSNLSPTEKYQNALKAFRKHFDSLPSSCSAHAEIRKFQERITKAFDTFFTVLLEDAFTLLGTPPCQYDIRVLGSHAKECPTPFSHLSLLCLIEDNAHKEYFQELLHVLELQSLSLGESVANIPTFTALGTYQPTGLYLARARHPDTIQTPQSLADLQHKKLPLLDGIANPTDFRNQALISRSLASSSSVLFTKYANAMESFPLQDRAIALFKARKQDYDRQWLERLNPHAKIRNLKTQYIRLIDCLIGDIALYFGIIDANPIDAIDTLSTKPMEVFSPNSAQRLKEAIASVYCIRARFHLEYGKKQETAGSNDRLGTKRVSFTKDEFKQLDRIYWLVIMPLYQILTELDSQHSIEKGLHRLDLTATGFLSSMHPLRLPKNLDALEPLVIYTAEALAHSKAPQQEHKKYYRALTAISEDNTLRELYLSQLREAHQKDDVLAEIPTRSGDRISSKREKKAFQQALEAVVTRKPKAYNGIEVKISSAIFQKSRFLGGSRYLSPNVIQQILDQDGYIRNQYPGSAHQVANFDDGKHQLHFKQKPSHPLMEYAVHNLFSRVAGKLSPETELVRFDITKQGKTQSYPVLVSQTIPGKSLKDNEDPKADIAQFTWHLLCAILLRPGDGRRSNYIIHKNKIYCIDNDIALVEPVVREGVFSHKKVQLLSVLFCLLDSSTPLDKKVLSEFANLDADAILGAWIEDVIAKEKEYLSLFSKQERDQLYNEDPDNRFIPTLLLKKGALATLSLQFWLLQQFIAKTSGEIYPGDLLKQLISLQDGFSTENPVGGYVYRHYQKTFKGRSFNERVKRLHSKNEGQSLSSSQSLMAALGKVPSITEIEGKTLYSPEEARKEFTSGLLRLTGVTKHDQLITSEDKTRIKSDFSNIKNGKNPDLARQLFVLKSLRQYMDVTTNKPKEITLRNCAFLDRKLLEPFLHNQLEILDLRGCSKITDKCVALIALKCPNLQELYLNGCSQLKKMGKPSTPLVFRRLEVLEMARCKGLTSISIDMPELVMIKASRNPTLKEVCIGSEINSCGFIDCKKSAGIGLIYPEVSAEFELAEGSFYLLGKLAEYKEQIKYKSPDALLKKFNASPRDYSTLMTLDFTNTHLSNRELLRLIQSLPLCKKILIRRDILNNTSWSMVNTVFDMVNNSLDIVDNPFNIDRLEIVDDRLDDRDDMLVNNSSLQKHGLNWCYKITNQGLELISGLTPLSSLTLDNCTHLADEGLGHISWLTSLSSLKLRGCVDLTDEGLKHISGLTSLSSLSLVCCLDITDEGLKHISGLNALTKLKLEDGTKLTGESLKLITRLTSLSSLSLVCCTWLTSEGLKHISGLNALTKLDLQECAKLTSEGLENISRLTSLSFLNLGSCTELTDKGLKYISELTSLSLLNLGGCTELTDKGLKHISGLSALTRLNFRGCIQLTDEEIRNLKEKMPNTDIYVTH